MGWRLGRAPSGSPAAVSLEGGLPRWHDNPSPTDPGRLAWQLHIGSAAASLSV